jgi:hypothetical protein
MSKATTTLLEQLHAAVANELLARIEGAGSEGSIASAADIGAAIKFLKDNSITAVIEDNADMAALQQKIADRRAKRAAAAQPTPAPITGPLTDDELDDAVGTFHVN